MPKTTKRARKSSTTGPRKKRKVSRVAKIKKAKSAVSRDILTEQYDKRVDYVHVKKPVNRKMMNFKKKVISALQTQQPLVTKLYTISHADSATAAAGLQAWQIIHLKPYDGQAATGAGYREDAQTDLKDIAAEISAVGKDLSENYWIKQAWVELTVINAGNTDGLLELYELDYVPRAGNPINQYGSFNAALTAAVAEINGLGTGFGVSGLNTRGVSPFDLSPLLRNYGIRVVKKMTSDVEAGQKFHYVLKDYRKHYVQNQALEKDLSEKFCIQGVTKSLLCVLRPTTNSDIITIRTIGDKHYRIQPTDAKQDEVYGGED